MSLQIIILKTNSQFDGSFSVSGVFWLAAPNNNIVQRLDFVSQVLQIDDDSLLALRSGAIIETAFITGLFSNDSTMNDIQIELQTQYQNAQNTINSLNPPLSNLINSTFDGYSWSPNLPTTFEPKSHVAISGIDGQAPAKGLGGFTPDPSNNPYQPNSDEIVSLYVDGDGSLVTRSTTLTDEGSFRDDFTGSALEINLTGTFTFTNGSDVVSGSGTLFTSELNRDDYIKLVSDGIETWARVERAPTDTSLLLVDPYSGSSASSTAQKTRWIRLLGGSTPGTASVSSSMLTVSSGTTNGGSISIYRDGDYLPFVVSYTLSISQRIANQTAFFGLRDDINNPNMYCDVILSGTNDKSITFRSAWNKDEENSSITLPAGLNTSQSLRYKIDISPDYCSLIVNGVLVSRHENHIPDPYVGLILCCGVANSSTVTDTDVMIDTVFFSNQDQLQITSEFSTPIAVINREDQHTISGALTTSSTTADQVIISYTVPAGRVFYLVGYRVQTSGTLSGNPVKIGRNSISSIPPAPGSVDSDIFRSFMISSGGDTGEADFNIPRRIGVGGDVVKVTVTPAGILSSTWYASLDFVLR